ncbi:hypothetical protein [Granulicella arctica]|uniref:Uncharacterized protein n=1 Tax=Granulicella arctica TaxID=940613 RepID=A0A7Y9TGD9_9BACT|nr:hypothetical protein [Granulicella arctica]NYF78655.1 hypothetical protein [Granulicella arctica]
MFGFSIHSIASPNRLVVTSPINLLMLLALGLITLWPLTIFLFKKPFPMGKVIGFSIFTVLVYGLIPSGARLTLDKTSKTATLTKYFFFHWTTETLDLASIREASLHTGSTTSQIQIQLADGSYRLLSELNQAGGKDQAVYEINQFLGVER